MDAHKLLDPEKVSALYLKDLDDIVSKMNNTKSLITDMKLKDTIKLDIVKLGKSEASPKEKVLPEDSLYRYLYQHLQENEGLKRRATEYIRSENGNID